MQKKEYTMYTKDQFMKIYEEMISEKGLLTTLVEMQTKTGINEQKAYEIANALIGEVAKFECTKDMMMEAPDAVVEDFFRTARNLQGYDRKVVLHEIAFGLGLYRNPELLEQVKEGASTDELFRAYYAAHGEDPALTEEVLEEDIRQKMAQFRVSPAVLRTMVKKLEKSKNVVFTSAALGKESLRFKCIVAMDQYLRSEGAATVADAVNVACTHVEVEAVADAVSRGQMRRDTATKIIVAVCLTALILGGLALIASHLAPSAVGAIIGDSTWSALNSAFGFAAAPNGLTFMELGVGTGAIALAEKLKTSALYLLFGGMGVAALSDHAADLVGKLTAKGTFFYQDDNTAVVDGLDELADFAEADEQVDDIQDTEEETVEEAEMVQDDELTVF